MRRLDAGGDIDGLVGEVAAALRRGEVVLLPTDTVYGLACAGEPASAAERVYRLKARPSGVRLPVIVSGPDQAAELGVEWPEGAARLAERFWPGPLTIAVGVRRPSVAWLEGRDEVGVRAPDHPLIHGVAARLGPFLMTSANRHGEPTPDDVDGVLASLDGAPDLVVDGPSGGGAASTLVNVNLPAPAVEREGAVPPAAISEVLAGGA